MNDKLASLSRDRTAPRAIFFRVAVTLFLLALIAATAIAFLLPERYASDCKLLVKFIEPTTNNPSWGREVVQQELQMINSEGVLGPVVDQLKLNSEWSKRYFNGQQLKTSETVEMLKKRLVLSQEGDGKVIAITVYHDDKNEPRVIAQAIIESYLEYSRAFHQKLKPEDEMLQININDLRIKINSLFNKTKILGQQFHIANDATGPQSPAEQPYWDAKNELAQRDQEYKKLSAKVDAAHLAQAFAPGTISNIAIVQPPTPAHLAMTKSKIFIYGGGAGIFLGLMAGSAAALVAARRGNLPPQNVAPALS